MKMKADFLNHIISVLLILLIVPGIVPGIASAFDGQLGDDGNSTLFSDLRIEKLSNDPKVPEPHSDAKVIAIVSNKGNIASDSTHLVYTIAGVESGSTEDVGSIGPGEVIEISHKWTTPDKDGTVTITASLEGVVNSQIETSVKINTPLPDLIIQNIVPEPANPQEGEPLNITVKVKNQGAADSGAALAKYYINEVPGQDIDIRPLAVGDSTTVEFSLSPDQVKEGKMEVRVVADSGNTVIESNEGNNGLPKTITVKSLLPDLTIESIFLSPATPKVGEGITFTATIKNNGPGASPTSKLNYNIIGNNETASSPLPVLELPAGQTTQTTFSWTPTNEGNIEVTALVDPDAVVPESDETNNQLTVNATVTKESTSTGGGGGGSSGSGKSSSSSGGGIGGSFSKEPVKNVAFKELATRNVVNGDHIRYDFSKNATCVMYIEYDAKRTFLRTTAVVEELKNKSTFVPELPSGIIYRHVNIWVGDKVEGLPTSLENGLIGFKVEKSWINSNSVNESLVTLQRYNKSWEPLYTEKVGEDNNYSYFTSKTPGYSFFAITASAGEANKNETQIGAKLQDTLLGSLESAGKAAINESGNKSKAQEAREVAKTLMAIVLPLFLICVGYLVLKKKI